MFVLCTLMMVWVCVFDPVEPPVCVVEPVVVPVLGPDVPPVVVGTVQPTPPLGAGPVQFDGLPGTVLPGCVFEVEPVPEPEPVVEPVVVPLPCVVVEVEVPVALPVPVVFPPKFTGAIVPEPVFPLDPVVVPDLVPVDEPELDPEPGDVELPVPVFGPVQFPPGPRTCPDGHVPPGRPGPLWPPVVAPEPQTPFT